MTSPTLTNLDIAFMECEDVNFTKRVDGKGRQEGGSGDYEDVVGCKGDAPHETAIGTGGTRFLGRLSVYEIWNGTRGARSWKVYGLGA